MINPFYIKTNAIYMYKGVQVFVTETGMYDETGLNPWVTFYSYPSHLPVTLNRVSRWDFVKNTTYLNYGIY